MMIIKNMLNIYIDKKDIKDGFALKGDIKFEIDNHKLFHCIILECDDIDSGVQAIKNGLLTHYAFFLKNKDRLDSIVKLSDRDLENEKDKWLSENEGLEIDENDLKHKIIKNW